MAYRNLLKRKVFSLINIMGLAIGMAVCLLIVLFIKSEVGYDDFHKNSDNIYRIALDRKYPGRLSSYAIIPQSIGDAVKHDLPEVKEYTRLFSIAGDTGFPFNIGEKVYAENDVYAADSTFFKVFTGDAIAGDLTTALNKPNTAVITKTTADKIFGNAAGAVGKQFEGGGANGKVSYLISAVIKDWPQKSHLHFNMLISTLSFPNLSKPNYTGFSNYTYLLLNKTASPASVESKFPQLIKKYATGEIGRTFGETYEHFQAAGNGYHYYLQPLKAIHLTSNLEAEAGTNGSSNVIYIFAIIAVFILGLACINFINLSTSLSVERAKEVGIRKTFGSEKGAIIIQFLIESIFISILSMVLAFVLAILFLPLFNHLANKDLSVLYFLSPVNLLLLVALAFGVGLVAGIYPAFILSSFNPITVLKGKFKSNKYGLALRNGLVIFQFAISIVLIIATITVNRQIGYMLGDSLGFNKDHVIVVNNAFNLGKNNVVFKDQLLNISGVSDVSNASTVPGNQNFFGITYQAIGSNKPVTGRGIVVDENYAKLLNLEMVKGRFFSKEFPADTLNLVLNEKAVTELGLTEPIGSRIISPGQNNPDGSPVVFTVIGVVHDFHYQSLHQKINPLIFNTFRKAQLSNVVAVRVKADNFKAAVQQIGTQWDKYVKDKPFNYSFLDQRVANQYLTEQTAQRLFTIFSALAIFIACIGLMGLAAYATQQRMREIGIRKVLGASVSGIMTMLSKDFLKLILWAALIAFPVAWWGINSWLQNFAYRVTIGWWVFLFSGALSVAIALLTISFHAVKAAVTNPVTSLRSE